MESFTGSLLIYWQLIVLVYGKTLLLVYHRDQYLAHFYSIYILTTFLFVNTAFLGNHAGGTTLYSIQNNPKSNQAILSYNFTTLEKWFYRNCMVLNPSKCFYMCLGSKSDINDFILEDRTKILPKLEHEVLGITIDTNLNFYSHLKQLCIKEVANKLNALSRIIIVGKGVHTPLF